jgi:hypothetical protein
MKRSADRIVVKSNFVIQSTLKMKTQKLIRYFGFEIRTGGLYLMVLFGVVLAGLSRYHYLYSEAPSQAGYRMFVQVTGLFLAVLLSFWAAIAGIRRRNVMIGILVLGLGGVLTMGGLSLLPWIRLPEDQYAVAALWGMAYGIPTLVLWLIVSLAGWPVANR